MQVVDAVPGSGAGVTGVRRGDVTTDVTGGPGSPQGGDQGQGEHDEHDDRVVLHGILHWTPNCRRRYGFWGFAERKVAQA